MEISRYTPRPSVGVSAQYEVLAHDVYRSGVLPSSYSAGSVVVALATIERRDKTGRVLGESGNKLIVKSVSIGRSSYGRPCASSQGRGYHEHGIGAVVLSVLLGICPSHYNISKSIDVEPEIGHPCRTESLANNMTERGMPGRTREAEKVIHTHERSGILEDT